MQKTSRLVNLPYVQVSTVRPCGRGHTDQQGRLRTARDELQQELVQLRGLAGVLVSQRATPVDQKSEHFQLALVDHGRGARTRSGHCLASGRMQAEPPPSAAHRPPQTVASSAGITAIVAERLCGSVPIALRPVVSLQCSLVLRCLNRHWLSSQEGNAASSGSNPREPLLALATPGQRAPIEC